MSLFTNQWEKHRKKGRFRYSLQNGFIFATVIILFRNGIHFIDIAQGKNVDIDYASVGTNYFWFFIGAFLGYYFLIWWWKEKIYRKEKYKNKNKT